MNTPQQQQRKREGFIEPPGVQPPPRNEPAAGNGSQAAPVIEAPPEVAPAPKVQQWPVVVRLRRQIRNNKNELISEISFREPTGGDINRYGNPVRIDKNLDIQIDDPRMITMMGQLSGILPPMIEQMDTRDYATCAFRLAGFFIPDLTMWV